jgi:hypothetical protein
MNKNQIIFIILLFLSNLIFSENIYQLSSDFKKIIDIDENNKQLIASDFNKITYNEYFYYYSLASEELNFYEDNLKWFNEVDNKINTQLKSIFKTVDIKKLKNEKQKEFAEKLLIIIHDNILKKYYFTADRLSNIINGEYNCVSSSIIYSIFLKKYNFNHNAVQTTDHVFIKITFDDKEVIDVETTNKYGFDPGKKKEVMDEFGKITGFTYVPQNNYSNRTDIDLKSLIFDVYHNTLNYYFTKKDYLQSCKVAYIIYAAGVNKGKDDFNTAFNNLIANLAEQKLFKQAIDNINSYTNFIGYNERLINIKFELINNLINNWNDASGYIAINDYLLSENKISDDNKIYLNFVKSYLYFIYKLTTLENGSYYKNAFDLINKFLTDNPNNDEIIDFRFKLLGNYIYEWNDYDNFNDVNNYILYQNNLFDYLKDDSQFVDIYINLIYKQAGFYDKNLRFADSYNLIKFFNNRFSSPKIKNIFNNVMLDEFNYYKKNNRQSDYLSRGNELINEFYQFAETINKIKISYITEWVYSLSHTGNYINAISEYKKLYNENKNDTTVKNNLLNLYVDYTIKLYYNKDTDNMIKYCDEALSIFPDNQTLNNNYLSFLLNTINEQSSNGNIKKAKEILNIAKKRFPENQKVLSAEKNLK